MKILCTLLFAILVSALACACSEKERLSYLPVVDVGPVHVKKERPWYHDKPVYSKSLTDEEAKSAVTKIMQSFEMPPEFWDECLTAEEFIPMVTERKTWWTEEEYEEELRNAIMGIYTRTQGPPTYISKARIPGVKYCGRCKPYETLTDKEKLLLKRYYPFNVLPEDDLQYWESDTMLTVFAALMRNYWKNHSKTVLERADQLFVDYYDMRYLLDPRRRMKGSEWESWIHRWMCEYTSPITCRTFEPWHEEFSPGNGYFRLVTEDAVVDQLWLQLQEKKQTKFPRQDTYFMYYRIYGETQVIAEGFYAAYVGADPIERGQLREHVQGLRTESRRTPLFPGT